MRDGAEVPEGSLRDEGYVVALQGQDPQVRQALKGVALDAAQLVVGYHAEGQTSVIGR